MKNLFKKLFSFLGNKTQKEINNKLDIIISDLSLLRKELQEPSFWHPTLDKKNNVAGLELPSSFIDNIKKISNRIDKLYPIKSTVLSNHELSVDKIRKELNIVEKEKNTIYNLNNSVNKKSGFKVNNN